MNDRPLPGTAPRRAARRPAALALACAASLPVGGGAAAQAPSTDIFLARLELDGSRVRTVGWINVTNRQGYDNQPAFNTAGTAFFYTSQREGQADIYRYDLEAGHVARVTATPESEYSPTPMPSGGRFSTIRVEADSTQRLWKFRTDGTQPELVLANVQPVGYHAWGNAHTLGLFVLGSPATLQLADTRTGTAHIVAGNIGRSLHKVPGQDAISFLHQEGPESRFIKSVELSSRTVRLVAPAVAGNEYYAWLPDGTLIMGSGSKLFTWPRGGTRWTEIADLAAQGVTGISRLAVSPDGSRIAIVASDPTM